MLDKVLNTLPVLKVEILYDGWGTWGGGVEVITDA